jgi:hypothetical protein
MTGWDVASGRWRVTRAVGSAAEPQQTIAFERTAGVDLTFAPSQTTTWEFTLDAPAAPVIERPDLGIGIDDVKAGKGGLTVTVHSLGAKAAAPAQLVLEDAAGHELARVATPALAAPLDLKPKIATVALKSRAGWSRGMKLRLVSGEAEITQMNNLVVAP